jgi:hypothetical protein
MKQATSYRLSQRTLDQVDRLATAWNTSRADVISTAVDRAAQQEGIAMTSRTYTNQYWQHQSSGETYIVTVRSGGTVTAAAGPLHHSEVTAANLVSGFDSDADLVEELVTGIYRLVTPPYAGDNLA